MLVVLVIMTGAGMLGLCALGWERGADVLSLPGLCMVCVLGTSRRMAVQHAGKQRALPCIGAGIRLCNADHAWVWAHLHDFLMRGLKAVQHLLHR